MVHEQLWLLLSEYKEADLINAELVFIVLRLMMDQIKIPADRLALKIQEYMFQHRENKKNDIQHQSSDAAVLTDLFAGSMSSC